MRKFLKSIKTKLRAKAGETLVETLVAIVICVFASTLLANGVAAAGKLNRDARDADQAFRHSLEIVELRDKAESSQKSAGVVTIIDTDEPTAEEIEVDVTYVKSGDGDNDLTGYFTEAPETGGP